MTNLRDQHEKDLKGIFDGQRGLAQTVKYTSELDGPNEIDVFFEPEQKEPNPLTLEYEIIPPMITARTSDVPNVTHKDTFKVDDIIFGVLIPKETRAGTTIITLEEK